MALYIRIYDIWQNSTQGALLSLNDVAVTSLKTGPCETLSTVPIWEVYPHHCQDSEAIIHLETNKLAPWFDPSGRLLRRGCNSFCPVLFTTWHLGPTEDGRDAVYTGNGLAQGPCSSLQIIARDENKSEPSSSAKLSPEPLNPRRFVTYVMLVCAPEVLGLLLM